MQVKLVHMQLYPDELLFRDSSGGLGTRSTDLGSKHQQIELKQDLPAVSSGRLKTLF